MVRRVSAFCRARGARATIVFDGGPLRPDMDTQTFGGVTVRVPPQGRDADDVIRDLVERAPRAAEIIVVTSDKALYSYVRTLGASILRAHEWNALERQVASSPGSHKPRQADGGEKPDREADVDGWLKVFGGDD